MNFNLTMETSALVKSLKYASQICDNGKIPILKSALVNVANDRVTFTATNTEQSATITENGSGSGSVCIDVPALLAKASALPSGSEVNISGDDKFVTIKSGKSRWKMPVLPAVDFPIEIADEIPGGSIDVGADFSYAVNCVSGAADTQIGKSISGIHIDGSRIVATNGHQLRIVEIDVELGSATIPTKLAKLFPETATIKISDNAISFSNGGITVKSKLIAGQYPDWKRVVSSFSDKMVNSASINRIDMISAINRAAAIRSNSSYVTIKLIIAENSIEIKSENKSDGEEGFDAIDAIVSGDRGEIGLNASYVLDSLKTLDCERVTIKYADASTPIYISPENSDRENTRIVMPVRV